MTSLASDEAAFEALHEQGFIFGYIDIDHKNKIIRPSRTAEYFLRCGWLPKGSKVVFLGEGGYEHQLNAALMVMAVGDIFTIKWTNIGSSSSSYEFEEIRGNWNTVMFGKEV